MLQIDKEDQLTLIDFPQMVSIGHKNANELFERDVECVIRFAAASKFLSDHALLALFTCLGSGLCYAHWWGTFTSAAVSCITEQSYAHISESITNYEEGLRIELVLIR